jgi:hypothetical protein
MFTLYERVANASQAGTFPFLFDSLYGVKKIALTPEQTKQIVESLEDILKLSSGFGTQFNPHSAEGAATRLAANYRKLNQPDDVRRVWKIYGMSLEEAAKHVKRGRNIRNHVSHGLTPAVYFNSSVSQRIVHVVSRPARSSGSRKRRGSRFGALTRRGHTTRVCRAKWSRS